VLITCEAVFAIADRFTKAGIEVTNRSILDELGGGSMAGIARFLREWRERQHMEESNAEERGQLPETVSTEMQNAAVRIWKAALDHNKTEIEGVRQKMNDRIAAADKQCDDALTDLKNALDELTSANLRVVELEKQLKTEAARMRIALEQARDRAAAADALAVRHKAEVDERDREIEKTAHPYRLFNGVGEEDVRQNTENQNPSRQEDQEHSRGALMS
jgi:hypothetical protein